MADKNISVDILLAYLTKNEKYLTRQIEELIKGSDDDLSDISEEDAEELHELQGAIDTVCEIKDAILGKTHRIYCGRLNPKIKLTIPTNNTKTKSLEKKNRFADIDLIEP